MRVLLLATALLAQPAAVAASVQLRVGGFALLTSGATVGQPSRPLPAAVLMDRQGHPVPGSPWFNRPLKVVQETRSAYQLADGSSSVWLSKTKLFFKAVFPLKQTSNTEVLARQLRQGSVSLNGQPQFACESAPGYHAFVTTKAVQVRSVWSVEDGRELNLAPQGGLIQGDLVLSKRVSRKVLLVMLRPTAGVKFLAAELDPALQDRSAQLIRQLSARCTSLAGLYASVDDLHRTLHTGPVVAVPALPNDPDGQQQALIGWTKAQVLAHYGSPNEAGSPADLFKLNTWTLGGDAYSQVIFDFGPDGKVRRATVARSP